MKKLIVLSALCFLGAPAAAQDAAAPYDLTARNKADIIRQVKDKLLDGESARWRWPKHERPFGVYCGWVNAKNSYGAYTGFVPFMVLGGVGDAPGSSGEYRVFDATISGPNASDTSTRVVATMCADNGYDLGAPPPES